MTRTERQELSEQRVIEAGVLCTVEGVTGFGKTRIATDIIKLLRRNVIDREVIVVVPTIPLKAQWIEVLTKLSLIKNTEVYVINTLIKKERLNCSLLILDEIHRYAASTFSRVFDVVKYSFVLGLTATMDRLDGKHVILNQYAPVIDRITMAEAKRNGWLAPYMEYNLGVKMDEESTERYRKLTESYGYYSGKFQSDFELMKNCSYTDKPKRWVNPQNQPVYFDPEVVKYARRLGWNGNNARTAWNNLQYNKTAPRGEKRDLWDNDDHPYAPQKLFVWAIQGMRLIREMVKFIHTHPAKVAVAERLVKGLDRKAITFCEATSVADELAERLGKSARIYHSNMEGGTKRVRKVKDYKTEHGADKWVTNHPEWRKRRLRNGNFRLYTFIERKVSAKEMREDALYKLQNSRRIMTVCTAKALDQGFDFPGAELGIIYGRTSSTTQQIQRTGRVVRKHTFDDGTEKRAIIVNVYLQNTKDEKWLKRCQRKSAGAVWVNSVNEIFERELNETETVAA